MAKANSKPKPVPTGRGPTAAAVAKLASQGVSPDGTVVANGRFETIGQPGFQSYGGFVLDDILRELVGTKARALFREMADNDSTCGALLFAFYNLLNSATWEFQPVDDSPEAEEYADFASEVFFEDMSHPWSDAISDAASMLVFGFAVEEIVWKKRDQDNRIGIDRFAARDQASIWQWRFDPKTWDVTHAVQQPPSGTQIAIPLEKCVHIKTQSSRGNPEGRSILRSAYRSWSLKKRIENIEGIGIERDLAGLPVMKVPQAMLQADADPLQKQALVAYKNLVRRIRRDSQEGIVLPSSRDQQGHLLFELELLTTGGSRSFDTTKVLDRYGKAIAMSVLADFIYLGQQSVGSFALSSDKTALFATAVGGFLDRICDAHNMQTLPRLWAYNNLPPELMPKMKHSDVEQMSLADIAALLTAMTSAGAQVFPDRDLENALRTRAGLPLAPEDQTVDDQGAAGDDPQGGNTNNPGKTPGDKNQPAA